MATEVRGSLRAEWTELERDEQAALIAVAFYERDHLVSASVLDPADLPPQFAGCDTTTLADGVQLTGGAEQ